MAIMRKSLECDTHFGFQAPCTMTGSYKTMQPGHFCGWLKVIAYQEHELTRFDFCEHRSCLLYFRKIHKVYIEFLLLYIKFRCHYYFHRCVEFISELQLWVQHVIRKIYFLNSVWILSSNKETQYSIILISFIHVHT